MASPPPPRVLPNPLSIRRVERTIPNLAESGTRGCSTGARRNRGTSRLREAYGQRPAPFFAFRPPIPAGLPPPRVGHGGAYNGLPALAGPVAQLPEGLKEALRELLFEVGGDLPPPTSER